MRIRSCAVFFLAILVASCGKIPPIHYYMLEPEETTEAPGGPGLRIGVEPFHVSPPYDRDRIAYRVGPGNPEIGFYAYHRWASPLSEMIPAMVAGSLGGLEGVALMEPALPDRAYDALLGGRILAIEEVDTDEGNESHVRLDLLLRLADGQEVWGRTLSGTAVTRQATVESVVQRMGDALRQALDSGRSDLASAIDRIDGFSD